MNGKNFKLNTIVYKKYEMPIEYAIAKHVDVVKNNEPVYSHMHPITKKPPRPTNHVSWINHESNTEFFTPGNIQKTSYNN